MSGPRCQAVYRVAGIQCDQKATHGDRCADHKVRPAARQPQEGT